MNDWQLEADVDDDLRNEYDGCGESDDAVDKNM
jgi:hypothetical protein